MSLDWVSLGIVVVAYLVTSFSKLSVRVQNGINALAMCAVIGWRAYAWGFAGTNGLITAVAAVLAVVYAVRAIRS